MDQKSIADMGIRICSRESILIRALLVHLFHRKLYHLWQMIHLVEHATLVYTPRKLYSLSNIRLVYQQGSLGYVTVLGSILNPFPELLQANLLSIQPRDPRIQNLKLNIFREKSKEKLERSSSVNLRVEKMSPFLPATPLIKFGAQVEELGYKLKERVGFFGSRVDSAFASLVCLIEYDNITNPQPHALAYDTCKSQFLIRTKSYSLRNVLILSSSVLPNLMKSDK
ncbi:hypothetical protein VNO77_20251 [Canavalia gladiata]|uniref:Uncharacterized protein n=1 Tax=Canavalia gladiata TaxID=3824 RepID=A0AAN9QL49_CANGL